MLPVLFVAMEKTQQKPLKEGRVYGAHGLKVWAIMGKAWWQMHEAAGHMTFSVRKQRDMNDSAQPASLFQYGTPVPRMLSFTFRLDSPAPPIPA